MDKDKNGDATKETKRDAKKDDKESGSSKDKGRGGKSSQSTSNSKSAPSKSGTSDGKQDGSSDTGKVAGGRKTEDAGPVVQILEQIKKLGATVNESKRQVSERLDEHAAQISFLKDEWNIKCSGGSKEQTKKKVDDVAPKMPHDSSGFSDEDDDEALREVFQDEEDEDFDEEDEDKEDEMEEYDEVLFGKEQKGIVPTEHDVAAFIKRTKLSEAHAEDEWRNVKAKTDLKYWVGRAEAKDFIGPQVDVDAPDLRYRNLKQSDKDLGECQKYMGAMNLAQIKLAQGMKDLVANSSITMAEFANPDVPMADPRQDAALSMEGVKEAAGQMMKSVGSLGKMAGFVYLKLLTMRRAAYIESVNSSRTARDMVKRLQPTTRYLFGDSIKTVCRTLKEGSQLTTQLQRGRGGTGWRGRGGIRRGSGGHRGGNRGGFRGGLRGGFRRRGNFKGKPKDE